MTLCEGIMKVLSSFLSKYILVINSCHNQIEIPTTYCIWYFLTIISG